MKLLLVLLAGAMLLPSTSVHAESGGQVRVTQLFGSPLVNQRGEALGEITDLVFDARNGALRAVAVYGVALPVSRLQPEAGGRRYVLTQPDDSRASTFAQPRWPSMRASVLVNHEVVDRLHRDFGEIRDVLVDLDRRRVSAVIIDRNDDWQVGRALVTVPVEALALPRDVGDKLALNYSRERFE